MSAPDAADGLMEIAREVRECTRCDLHRMATCGVPGEGPANARVMMIGEAPGRNENKTGRPFVGAAGQFLNELLGVAGLQRTDVFITNVVKHWPPENRDPTPAEVDACKPYLDRQIALINPPVIVTLGRWALNYFFPEAKITQVHGQPRRLDGRNFFPLLHPAAALYKQDQRPVLIADMRKLALFLHQLSEQRDSGSPDRPDGGEDLPEQLSLF